MLIMFCKKSTGDGLYLHVVTRVLDSGLVEINVNDKGGWDI